MDIAKLRGRLAELGITQQDLADALGINATLLNHILKRRRKPPEGFEACVNATLDRLEAAEKAAEEARERVLAGEGVEEGAG